MSARYDVTLATSADDASVVTSRALSGERARFARLGVYSA